MWNWCDMKIDFWVLKEGLFEGIFGLDLENLVEYQHLELWGLRGGKQLRLQVRRAYVKVQKVSGPRGVQPQCGLP